ncbi:MAG: TfoX/Sxy family protein [Burkholderiales bacterium]
MTLDSRPVSRVRRQLAPHAAVENRMFGGVAFMIKGHMCLGVPGSELIVRLSPESAETALAEGGTRPFDLTGRQIKGWLLVSSEGTRHSAALSKWIRRGVAFTDELPKMS